MSEINLYNLADHQASSTTEDEGSDVQVVSVVTEIDATFILIASIKEYSELLQQTNPQHWYRDERLNKQLEKLQNRVSRIVDELKGVMGRLESTDKDEDRNGDHREESLTSSLETVSVDLVNQKVNRLTIELTSISEALGGKFHIPKIQQARQTLSKFPNQINTAQSVVMQKRQKSQESKLKRNKQKQFKNAIRRKWEQFKSVVLRKKKRENELIR